MGEAATERPGRGGHAGHRGMVHDRRSTRPARDEVHDVRLGVLPPHGGLLPQPACDGETFEETELSRRGTVWSYTDAQYQPPAPYIPASDPYVPFALAAVELPEGIVVLGQLAEGHGVDDVQVGTEVELVVETLYTDDVR